MLGFFFHRSSIFASVAFLIGIAWPGTEKASAQEVKGVEELTRGPLHEAFGQPVVFDPQPGAVLDKQPPEPVDELPPDVRPEGDNIIWIPGYWSWDEQRTDFIWISGFWRATPPDRVWIAGYWAPNGERFQWVSGFWTSPAKPVEYVPAPPATLEIGPVNEPAAADQIWVPGCWMWRDTRFLWRPGYWIAAQAEWIWVPSYYNWTPRGSVFIDGYWDYAPSRRGMMFAPVYFDPAFRGRRDFVYTPSIILNTPFLTAYLFARPSYRHYYFGDYYAPAYLQAGVYPWFAFHNSRLGYDPFFAHSNWSNRRDPRWQANQRDNYWNLRQNENARPPQTYTAMRTAANRQKGDRTSPQLAFASNLGDFANQKQPAIALTRVDQQRRQEYQRNAGETRGVTQERAKWESAKTRNPKDPVSKSADRWDLPKQVVQIQQPKGKGVDAPPAPQTPKENTELPKVAPKTAPKVEDVLGQPNPMVKSKDPINPKGKDPLPKVKDPIPDPKLPNPKPKDPTPEPKPIPKPKDPTPEPKPNPKPKDPTPEPKPNPKPKDPTPEPKPNPKPKDPTPEPKPIPKPKDPTPEPKPIPKPKDPAPVPKVAPPTPQPKLPPPPVPKIAPPEPKPMPKAKDPAPVPKVAPPPPPPPPQPKLPPPPVPKVAPPEPKPMPKAAPPPQPKVAPPEPKPKSPPPAKGPAEPKKKD
ncbi:MAG: hypothetical protein K8T89_01070 [Planctomycetes bacterium]|nr:hypothetical protein [Planctomycetota bacterium]